MKHKKQYWQLHGKTWKVPLGDGQGDAPKGRGWEWYTKEIKCGAGWKGKIGPWADACGSIGGKKFFWFLIDTGRSYQL